MKSVSLWSSEFIPPSSEAVSGDVEDAVYGQKKSVVIINGY